MSEKRTGVTFEKVEQAASQMMSQGVKPTVRGVMSVTGGNTETVSGFLRDFFNKRDLEVSKMADELGSGEIAKLLASEIKLVVDRKTAALHEIIERQKVQINELVELMEEKERDAQHKVDVAEAKSVQAIEQTEKSLKKSTEDMNTKVELAEKAAEIARQERDEAIGRIEDAEQSAVNGIAAAEQKAQILVETANSKADKFEKEAVILRDQVKNLTVEEAKREIEKAAHNQMKSDFIGMQTSLAESNTKIVQLQAEKTALERDVERMGNDLDEDKENQKKLSQSQTQVIELQKQLSSIQQQLAQSERERESLSQALAVKTAAKKK